MGLYLLHHLKFSYNTFSKYVTYIFSQKFMKKQKSGTWLLTRTKHENVFYQCEYEFWSESNEIIRNEKHEYVDVLWLISTNSSLWERVRAPIDCVPRAMRLPYIEYTGVSATFGQAPAMFHVLFVVMMWANIFPVIYSDI